MRTGDAALIAGVTHLPARILNQFAVGNYRQRRFFSTDINVSLLSRFLPVVAAKAKRIQVSDKRFVIRWRRETSNKTASADFSRNFLSAYHIRIEAMNLPLFVRTCKFSYRVHAAGGPDTFDRSRETEINEGIEGKANRDETMRLRLEKGN